MQLKFIDDDVRFVNCSTLHPRHDITFLLNEVHNWCPNLKTKIHSFAVLVCQLLGGTYRLFVRH
ncbi:YqiA/YcfP family alpha/beta fold hydrolase [Aggregatibacter actinomycetemcomitans]|uniref:YqiA/YcfP family alpha/beta fold hydrolase n=1 Tax=Aggregatibacter actinomycetemcomitans TaxID=714 RepID=UPI0037098540